MRHADQRIDSLMCDHVGTLPSPAPSGIYRSSKPLRTRA